MLSSKVRSTYLNVISVGKNTIYTTKSCVKFLLGYVNGWMKCWAHFWGGQQTMFWVILYICSLLYWLLKSDHLNCIAHLLHLWRSIIKLHIIKQLPLTCETTNKRPCTWHFLFAFQMHAAHLVLALLLMVMAVSGRNFHRIHHRYRGLRPPPRIPRRISSR